MRKKLEEITHSVRWRAPTSHTYATRVNKRGFKRTDVCRLSEQQFRD